MTDKFLEEEVEVESGEGESRRVRHVGTMDEDMKYAQNLSHEVCGVIIKLWNKDARAVSVHVRHASVEVQVQCVNVVIGVVSCLLYASFQLLFVMML